MPALYRYLFAAMWLAWLAYWWISSRGVKVTVRRESVASRLSYMVPLVLAVLLLATPRLPAPMRDQFLPPAQWAFILGAVLTAAGLVFSVWARRHLGGNWSGEVTIKRGHELITSGPYAIVRHPIYTGLILAFVGSAIAISQWRAVIAVALATLSFVYKLRREERWMLEHFGAAYRAYRSRVRALVPFVV